MRDHVRFKHRADPDRRRPAVRIRRHTAGHDRAQQDRVPRRDHDVVAEYVSTNQGSTWALAREFVWGERFPELVALIDYTAAGEQSAGTAEPFYYLRDALGSVVALVDEGGEVVERYTYEPYGTPLISNADGSAIRAVSAYGNPFGFTGQRYDAAVGLYHFRHRSYSPRLGRWLQPDPAGYPDGVNLFEYVRSNPITGFDPWGLEKPKRSDNWDYEDVFRAAEEASGPNPKPAIAATAPLVNRGIKDPRFPTYEELRQAMDWAAEKAAQAAQMGIPIVGDASDLYSAIAGRDPLTGETLSVGQRVAAGVGVALGSRVLWEAVGKGFSNVRRTGLDDLAENARRDGCHVPPAAPHVPSRIPAIAPPKSHGGLRRAMGTPPEAMVKPQAHHDLPWAFRDWFAGEGRGLDVNDASFGRWIEGAPVGKHQNWSRSYQTEWAKFIHDNHEASRQEVLDRMNELRKDPRFQ